MDRRGRKCYENTVIPRIPCRAFLWMICIWASTMAGSAQTSTTNSSKAKGENGWSLKPVVRPELPAGSETNPIDRFINGELRARGIKAACAADKLTLLRRVHLDLTGIPPTPAEQEAFLADTTDGAYEKVVDRLLADEQHAVRYARHWLDVLRYADADERMTAAPGIHLWRDWVINALHDDVPYDQFVQIQLTGVRSSERSQMSATGYRSRQEPRPGDQFALGLLARGTGEDPQDLAISAVDTVSAAFLGMTVSCAKCHDHMYDPISQRQYYEMKALFDPLVLRKVTLASAADIMANGKAAAAAARERAPLEKAASELAAPYKAKLYEERILMLPPDAQAVIRKPEKQRTAAEQKIADDYFPILRIDGDKITEAMPEEVRKKYRELQKQAGAAGSGHHPPALPVFYTVETDRLREQEKSYILTSGDPARPQKNHEVSPGWPFEKGNPDFRDGRIEAFADWLTAPENPLFARVAVNRLWQWHFGEGLLKNASDFGELGGKPSNPALLDWLASEFVARGYSLREMHRLMVTSETYKRSSEAGADLAESQKADPTDTALWHFRLQRVEAEQLWDAMHAAAGDLDLQVGGPSFDPRDKNAATARRGTYMVRGYSASRDATPHFLVAFDVDDGRAPCPLRTQTVTAPQALFLMNSPDIDKASAAMAARLRQECKEDLPAAVNLAFRLALSRPPSSAEKDRALAFLENDPGRLSRFCWLLFNLDEFIYVR